MFYCFLIVLASCPKLATIVSSGILQNSRVTYINLRTMGLIKVLHDFLRPTYVIDPKNAVSMERYPVQVD